MDRIKYLGLGFGASWVGNAQKFDLELLFRNPIVSKIPTPILESQSYSNLWWREDLSEMGISLLGTSVSWIPSQVIGYVIEVTQPGRFEGSCAFGVIAEELPERTRLDRFLCVRATYSMPCLLGLMQIMSKLSEVSPKPVTMIVATSE